MVGALAGGPHGGASPGSTQTVPGAVAGLPVELPALMPSCRARTSPRRRAAAPATPRAAGPAEAWHVEGALEVRSGLQKLLEQAGRLARGDDPSSQAGREIAAALEEQMRCQRECLDWLCRASGSGSGAFSAQAEALSMQAFRKQRSGVRMRNAIQQFSRSSRDAGFALPSVPGSARARNPTEGEDSLCLQLSSPAWPEGRQQKRPSQRGAGDELARWEPAPVVTPLGPLTSRGAPSARGSLLHAAQGISPKSLASGGLHSALSQQQAASSHSGSDAGPSPTSERAASSRSGGHEHGPSPDGPASLPHVVEEEVLQARRRSLASLVSTGSEAQQQTTVLVSEPHRRCLSARQFMAFFQKFCGDVVFEGGNVRKPLCMPTKLAERCMAANRTPEARSNRDLRLETNLYAVNELLIKPHTSQRRISYAELLNDQGLDVDYFVSHHWAEDFGELMQSILRHAAICGPSICGCDWEDVAYWCCAFANNQHAVSLGKTLFESPFYLALTSEQCRGTVMCLNQVASALDRIWCIYEVYLTHSLNKPFALLNCRQGPVGSGTEDSSEKDSWVIHIFNLLQHIDVREADSSNEEDKRKILHAIESFERHEDGQRGAEALNTTVRSLLARQALYTLVRRGDAAAVRCALELKANPDEPDTQGVRPLTYAVGHDHHDVAKVLIEHGADQRASLSAREVIAMWSHGRAERQRAIDAVQRLKDSVRAIHAQAMKSAIRGHMALRVEELLVHLYSKNPDLRLEVVREIWHMLQLLVRNGDEHLGEAFQHLKKLAPFLGDSDIRMQREALEVFNGVGELKRELLRVAPGTIHCDHLQALVEEDTKSTILHLAARHKLANGFWVLATGVAWTDGHPALRALDANGRNFAHLAALSGHVDALSALAGKARQTLQQQDSAGRTPVHYAALRGDVGVLQAMLRHAKLTHAQILQPDAQGCTLAHVAASGGHADFLAALVREFHLPPSLYALEDAEGRSVPHLLAARGEAECLELLVGDCRLPPEALEAQDGWHRTPAHVAALADAPEVLRVLGDAGAPLHLPMGPEEPGIGAVALVKQPKGLYACFTPEWQLGRVYYGPDRHGNLRFEYDGGQRDHAFVSTELCTFAPTPLLLAEKFGKQRAYAELTRSWGAVGAALGIQREELIHEAAAGGLPAGLIVAMGRPEALPKLVQSGALSLQDVRRPDGRGRSCLHRAVDSGQADVVRAVLGLGAFDPGDLSATDSSGRNVAHHAAACGDVCCLREALEACHLSEEALGAGDAWHRTPVHAAVESGIGDIVTELVRRGAPWHLPMGPPQQQEGTVALVRPARGGGGWQLGRIAGHVFGDDRFTFRYQNGGREACVEGERCVFVPTPLLMAERLGQAEASEALLAAWAEFASLAGLEEAREVLLQDALQGGVPAGAVAALGRSDVIKGLVRQGHLRPQDFLQMDCRGRSALHRAAASGSAETLAVVADLGCFSKAQLAATDMAGWTVVHHAAASDDSETVRQAVGLFPAPPVDQEMGDRWHHTPAHVAAAANATNSIRTLIDLGVTTGEPMGRRKLEEGCVIMISREGQRLRKEQRRVSLQRRGSLGLASASERASERSLVRGASERSLVRASTSERASELSSPSASTAVLPTVEDVAASTAPLLVESALEPAAADFAATAPMRTAVEPGVELSQDDPLWALARVRSVVGSELQVKYHDGRYDMHLNAEHCEVAPTALRLAELLEHRGCAAILRSRGTKRHTTTNFMQMAHVASFTSRMTGSLASSHVTPAVAGVGTPTRATVAAMPSQRPGAAGEPQPVKPAETTWPRSLQRRRSSVSSTH